MPDEKTDASQGGGTQTGDDNKSSEEKSGTQTEDNKSSEETTDEGKKEKAFTQADINRMLAKERKDWEKKAKDAEERAKLSEDERAKAEIAELRTQLKERDSRDAVTNEAIKLGAKNPGAAWRLVKDDLEFDDKGNISNLKEVFDTVKTDFPELFGEKTAKSTESIDAGAGKGGETAATLTKEKIEKMSQAEIIANMPEIDKFLKSQK